MSIDKFADNLTQANKYAREQAVQLIYLKQNLHKLDELNLVRGDSSWNWQSKYGTQCLEKD
jgi:hypothetical protein